MEIDSQVNLEDSYFIKNGEKLQIGPSFQNGNLVLAELTPTDSGKYYFVANSKNTYTTKHGPVVLKG